MKVLIASRTDIAGKLTGDRIIISETADALRKEGVEVDVSSSLQPDMKQYDVIHLVGTLDPYDTYIRLRKAKDLGKPVVVSTIYWDWDSRELREEQCRTFGRNGYYFHSLLRRLKQSMPSAVTAHLMKIRNRSTDLPIHYYEDRISTERKVGLENMRAYIYLNADVLLPNSHAEYSYLTTKYGTANDYLAVYDGVKHDFTHGDASIFELQYGIKNFVLCVGKICLRKNQLRLIKAMQSISCPLVLIGSEEKDYARLCRKIGQENAYFLGQMDREKIMHAFAAAKVHVLPSFYETPGIVSLEAALADCAIVSTDRGCTMEYFGNEIFYCQPTSVESIRNAVIDALRTGPNPALKSRIKKEYTWTNAADATIQGYNIALKKSKRENGI